MLTINRSFVIYEIFESEVVIINLNTGSYYSLDKAGAEIWRLLERPTSDAVILEEFSKRYEGDRAQIEQEVRRFLDDLQQNSLIAPVDMAETVGFHQLPEAGKIVAGATKSPFEPPIVHKYTDMEELLLLDPIHEVDEMGWPNAKPDQA